MIYSNQLVFLLYPCSKVGDILAVLPLCFCVFVHDKFLSLIRYSSPKTMCNFFLRHRYTVFCMDGTIAPLSVSPNFLWSYSSAIKTCVHIINDNSL